MSTIWAPGPTDPTSPPPGGATVFSGHVVVTPIEELNPACNGDVVGPLVTELLKRIRDPEGLGTTRTFARKILGYAQQLVNGAVSSRIEVREVATEPRRLIYKLTDLAPNAIKVLKVTDGERDVTKLSSWKQLAHIDRQWSRRLSTRFQAFAMIGNDLIVIYPAKPEASTVRLRYSVATDLFTQDADVLCIQDEYVPLLLDVAEAILLLRKRNYVQLEEVSARIATGLKA